MRLYDYTEEVRHELQQNQTMRWVDETAERGEEWGKDTPYFQALQALARKDYVSAVSPLKQPETEGRARSQVLLAALYMQGKSVPQDYNKAAELDRKSAAQGNSKAQAVLASLDFNGKGVFGSASSIPRARVRARTCYGTSRDQESSLKGLEENFQSL